MSERFDYSKQPSPVAEVRRNRAAEVRLGGGCILLSVACFLLAYLEIALWLGEFSLICFSLAIAIFAQVTVEHWVARIAMVLLFWPASLLLTFFLLLWISGGLA